MASIAGGAAAASSAGAAGAGAAGAAGTTGLAASGAGTAGAASTAGSTLGASGAAEAATGAATGAGSAAGTTGAIEGASTAASSTPSFWGAINDTFRDFGNEMASQATGGFWKGNAKDTFTKDNVLNTVKDNAENYIGNEIKKESEEGKNTPTFSPMNTVSDENMKNNKVNISHPYKNEKAPSFFSQVLNGINGTVTGVLDNVMSDENLKEDIHEAGGIIPEFAEIDSYLYKYKPEAQEQYAGTGRVNDENNFGIMAQDLQQNPLTQATVIEDENGNLSVDGSRLATVNTAVISELCRKVMELENIVYGRS